MGFLIDISDDAIANPCTSNIVKLSACQKDFSRQAEEKDKANFRTASRCNQISREIGAGDEIRTHDIYLGKVTLYP